MSSKAKSLRKKLHAQNKKNIMENSDKSKEKSNEEKLNKSAKELELEDPLDFFNNEHIDVSLKGCEEFEVVNDLLELKLSKNKPNLGPQGMYRPDFDELLQAKYNLKKSDGVTLTTLNEYEEEIKDEKTKNAMNDFIKLPELNAEQQKKLYNKLIRARKRFNAYYLRRVKVTISDDIHRLARELQNKLDIPKEILKEITKVMGNIKLPDNCIIDSDVRKVIEGDKFDPLVKKKLDINDIRKIMGQRGRVVKV